MATVAIAPDPPQPKSSILIEVTLSFEHMTWGDLRRFVELADRNHVSDLDEVALDFEPDVDDFEPTGLMFRTRDGDI
jgi:hypothetical protein